MTPGIVFFFWDANFASAILQVAFLAACLVQGHHHLTRRRLRRAADKERRRVIAGAAIEALRVRRRGARRAVLGLSPGARPKRVMTIADVPCGLCQKSYNAPHHCEEPYYCPCDHGNLHLDVKRIETLQVDPRTPFVDSPKPLELEPPEFDFVGGSKRANEAAKASHMRQTCKHEERCEEFGSFHQWCVRCGVELEEKTLYDGRVKWMPVKGPKGCTHEAEDLEMVYTSNGLLVAWICTKCNVDGRFPWPEEEY